MRWRVQQLRSSFSDRFDRAKQWFERYERRISSLALISGFIFDYLTLTRIDQLYDNLVIVFYLLVAATSIVFIHLYESWTFHKYVRPGGKFDAAFGWVHLTLPTVLQFAFGGLFSAFLVFYSRSATLAGSWPFLVLLIGLMIGNEFFRRRYVRLSFQVSILFFVLFSYAIFVVPIVVGSIGWWVFLISGAVTLAVILGFLYMLSRLIPTRFRQSRYSLMVSIGSIFLLVNVLYFTNIIPPIPLSLQQAGIYHSVERTSDNEYVMLQEKRRWYEYFRPTTIVHATPGDTLYAFSSVFAPSDLRADIIHRWQYYDEAQGWVTRSNVEFPVIGGRDAGFRGYSYKSGVGPGYWRVTIMTPDGRTIGRIVFEVRSVEGKPIEFESVIL